MSYMYVMSKPKEAKSLETSLLVRELKDVEWDTLGTYLGLTQGEIREIESDHQNTGRRRIVMFEKWLSKEESPSWEMIIAALKDMDENSLASKLRKKYLYQQEPQDAKSQTPADQTPTEVNVVVKVDRQDEVARELERLETKYFWLVVNAQKTMVEANLSVIVLETFSMYYLNNEVTTVKELFQLIKPFCFLDYSLP